MTTSSQDAGLRERREAIVREHVEAENRQDIEATIATFDRPRYEVNGEASDGEGAVRELLHDMLVAFPEFHAEEAETIRHADDAVIVEGRVTDTHRGPIRWAPADRPRGRLPARRDLRVRGRSPRLREGLLRHRDDPPAARRPPRARSGVVGWKP